MSALFFHRPRRLMRLNALASGFFWIPCPICGREFGGQEWHHANQSIPVLERVGGGEAICPWCAADGWGWPDRVPYPSEESWYAATEDVS